MCSVWMESANTREYVLRGHFIKTTSCRSAPWEFLHSRHGHITSFVYTMLINSTDCFSDVRLKFIDTSRASLVNAARQKLQQDKLRAGGHGAGPNWEMGLSSNCCRGNCSILAFLGVWHVVPYFWEHVFPRTLQEGKKALQHVPVALRVGVQNPSVLPEMKQNNGESSYNTQHRKFFWIESYFLQFWGGLLSAENMRFGLLTSRARSKCISSIMMTLLMKLPSLSHWSFLNVRIAHSVSDKATTV
jgi:hypothetical protein